jgi:ABC-type branched-subunit amino acid transport system permease subunit
LDIDDDAIVLFCVALLALVYVGLRFVIVSDFGRIVVAIKEMKPVPSYFLI